MNAKDTKKEACKISENAWKLCPLGTYLIEKIEIGRIGVALPPAPSHAIGFVTSHNRVGWRILEKDISHLKHWKEGQRVVLMDDPSYKKKLRFLLVNTDQNSVVRIDDAFCSSPEKLKIKRISPAGDEIELIDGSLWKIHSQIDRNLVLKWEELKDYVIVACEFAALKEHRSGYTLICPKNYSGIDLRDNTYIGTSKISADLQP